jgi:hypothetical protein
MKIIAESPPAEMSATGLEIDCQCARCGSTTAVEDCHYCEDGFDGHDCGEDCCCCSCPEPNVRCRVCDGLGVWHTCLSSSGWCQANPLPGRETTERGKIEWFTVEG